MLARARASDPFALAGGLIDAVWETGPEHVAQFWDALSDRQRLEVATILACQVHPLFTTLSELRAQVDAVAELGTAARA